jgi:hypothetical protein
MAEPYIIGPAHIRALQRQVAETWTAEGITTLLDSHEALRAENARLRELLEEALAELDAPYIEQNAETPRDYPTLGGER